MNFTLMVMLGQGKKVTITLDGLGTKKYFGDNGGVQ